MSVPFHITPIDAEAKDRFKQVKSKIPRKLPVGRAPTPVELRKVIDSLKDFVAEYIPAKPKLREHWDIDVRSRKKPKSGPGAFIVLLPLKSTTKPLPSVHIESGHPEVAALIAVEIFRLCGPQLLDGEDIFGPHLVDGNRSAIELVEAMEAHASDEFAEYNEEFDG